eukprot:gene21459-27493_t
MSDQRVTLFLVLLLPTLNVISDVAYLLMNDFYHWSLIVAERQSDMIYFAKFPVFGRSGRLPLLSMQSHHNLRSLLLELFVNVWFHVWTGSTMFSTDIDVDTEALDECLREEFYFESMPQVALQLDANPVEATLVAVFTPTQAPRESLNHAKQPAGEEFNEWLVEQLMILRESRDVGSNE